MFDDDLRATSQRQTMDVSNPDKPHWDAGQVKVDEIEIRE